MKLLKCSLAALCLLASAAAYSGGIKIKVDKQYLNIPVSHTQERGRLTFEANGTPELSVNVRLADGPIDYWVFRDVSSLRGKTLKLEFDGERSGLKQIYLSDSFAGEDSLYAEKNRPQFHFTTRRGWINDPNGLVWHDGEYHLFYQHNPYEREWGNMHWGHAVSKDLVHWQELPDALFPDALGTMFSGSAVVDHDNTAGFNRRGTPAMMALYTADSPDRETQCIAYSLDNGRTFTKYAGNPVIDSKERWNSRDTRDPKVFWHAPAGHWVMVLYEHDGHSIYTSADLKKWDYQSHVTGFFECPELFELPVDGDPSNTRWVMYGASGSYMLGSFDGRAFTPESGKHRYTTGLIYAAQTFTGAPDGRRIQIGWMRLGHPGMPFNGMMSLPTELTLRTTKDGPRLFSTPVAETEGLFTSAGEWSGLSSGEANELLARFADERTLRIKTTLRLTHPTSAGIDLDGQRILDYDLNNNTVNGSFYSPEDMTSMELTANIYIDRTSVEVFIDGGAYSYSLERQPRSGSDDGLRFRGNNPRIERLEVFRAESIW